MARKPKEPRRIHPLVMIGALNALNQSAGAIVATASTVATMLDALADNPAKVRMLAEELRVAAETFQAAVWPSEDGE